MDFFIFSPVELKSICFLHEFFNDGEENFGIKFRRSDVDCDVSSALILAQGCHELCRKADYLRDIWLQEEPLVIPDAFHAASA
jgi:hypothetical protein